MPKTPINAVNKSASQLINKSFPKTINKPPIATDSAFELVAFSPAQNSSFDASVLSKKIMAMQTTRYPPFTQDDDDVESPYQGFNLGLHVGDCAAQVEKNRHYLQTILPKKTTIQWLEQVHGKQVVYIEQVSVEPITADAAITREKNIALAVMTADCLPILLTSQKGDEIAAIHGGWRPLAANIIVNTLNTMQTNATDICAWLGPCIGKTAFEVGEEVKELFVALNPAFSQAFTAHTSGKYLADLQTIAQLQLSDLGVKNISRLPECTFLNTDKYYSYRKNGVTGRMASLICLR